MSPGIVNLHIMIDIGYRRFVHGAISGLAIDEESVLHLMNPDSRSLNNVRSQDGKVNYRGDDRTLMNRRKLTRQNYFTSLSSRRHINVMSLAYIIWMLITAKARYYD